MSGRSDAGAASTVVEREAEREALSRRYLEAWNAHDPEAVAAFFTEDAVYDDRGAAEVARGRQAIRAHVARVFGAFPDLHFELVRLASGERFSCAEWRCRMTHGGDLYGLPATGRSLESAGVDVATLAADGAIEHLVSYYDSAAMVRALGLLPARGSRTERLLARGASALARIASRR